MTPLCVQVECAKVRDGNTRRVTIQEGDVTGLRVMIVDDLVRSGGTLFQCALALKEAGAVSVSAFCSHAGFKEESWQRFAQGGDRCVFESFFVTNSVPSTTAELAGVSPYKVLDLMSLILEDL
jgi:phosphoribosylpyrophosphate synthetase